jgi:hypothetical protein
MAFERIFALIAEKKDAIVRFLSEGEGDVVDFW